MANPGKLDRRITIQVRTAGQDAAGSRMETWSLYMVVWAGLVTHRQTEAIVTDAERSVDRKTFRIRHRAITGMDHRVIYKGRIYNIEGVNEEGRSDTMTLDCVSTNNSST